MYLLADSCANVTITSLHNHKVLTNIKLLHILFIPRIPEQGGNVCLFSGGKYDELVYPKKTTSMLKVLSLIY